MEAFARRAAAPVFTLALFSSAALIFVLQPLFGRMVTPLLGGSPAVWNTSMAFFQGALLVGYLYAHLLARLHDLRLQAAIHAAVLLAAFLILPVQVTTFFGEPSSEHPALWLVGVLTLSVGAPFAAASATAPLLQAWYARTGRADASDPYYLYAASNLGSFIGLLAYPILIEPLLGASAQSEAWRAGYLLVTALILGAGAAAIASHGQIPPKPEAGPTPQWRTRLFWLASAAVPSALVLGVTLHISTDVASAPMLWVIPLALYLVTFILAFGKGGEWLQPVVRIAFPAAMALLLVSYARGDWLIGLVGNLAGFFLSALVCHLALARTRPPAGRLTEFYFWVSLGGVIGGAFAALAAPMIFNDVFEYPLALVLAALFAVRAANPDEWRLPDISAAAAGAMLLAVVLLTWWAPHQTFIVVGAIGAAAAVMAGAWGNDSRSMVMRYAFIGVAAVLAALLMYLAFNIEGVFQQAVIDNRTIFTLKSPWSFLLLGASFLTLSFCVHASLPKHQDNALVGDIAIGIAIPTTALLVVLALGAESLNARTAVVFAVGTCAIALLLNFKRPILMAAMIACGFTVIYVDDLRDSRVITQERSFFGVLRTVVYDDPRDPSVPPLRVLLHGTTIHGAQLAAPGLTRQPLTYYNPRTALGEAILAGLATSTTGQSRLALIGLGAGSTACLTQPNDELVIFEIDPAVVRLATAADGDFTYVPECQPNARIELGDARLQIAEEPNDYFDVIVVDAFSSDAIPAHLLTREALALYLSKLTPRGIVVLHLSNRNLALVSEAARVAFSLRAPALWRISERVETPYASLYGGLPASVMMIARTPDVFASLPLQSPEWAIFYPPEGRAWSDDYVNMPRALWESLNGAESCRTYPYLDRCKANEEEGGVESEPEPETPTEPAPQ